jgi:hypothetical protein
MYSLFWSGRGNFSFPHPCVKDGVLMQQEDVSWQYEPPALLTYI